MAPSYTSMISSLAARDITSEFDGLKSTFSSWDSCMSKQYCKWPVIAAIIVGSLIVLLIISSVVRCLCCGVECCCGCLACCNACCPSPRGRRSGGDTKYVLANQPYQPPQQHPYFPQPAMNYGAPATATFDAPSRYKGGAAINEDSLPAMPSWETAQSRRVRHENDDMEYHGATGEQENGDIALGGISSSSVAHRTQDHEQCQPMLQPVISPTRDYGPTGYQERQEFPTTSSAYPYQTQGAYAGGDLGGYPVQPQAQQPRRYDSTHSTVPPSYRSQASPSPYAQSYGNVYPPQSRQQVYNSSPENYGNMHFEEPSSTAYGGASSAQGRGVRFVEEPVADLFYPTPASRVIASVPVRKPVGSGAGMGYGGGSGGGGGGQAWD